MWSFSLSLSRSHLLATMRATGRHAASASTSASNQILTRQRKFHFYPCHHVRVRSLHCALFLSPSLPHCSFCQRCKHVRAAFDVRTESRVATACSGNVTVLRLDCGCRVKCFYKFNCDSAFVRSGCECARESRQANENINSFIHFLWLQTLWVWSAAITSKQKYIKNK